MTCFYRVCLPPAVRAPRYLRGMALRAFIASDWCLGHCGTVQWSEQTCWGQRRAPGLSQPTIQHFFFPSEARYSASARLTYRTVPAELDDADADA